MDEEEETESIKSYFLHRMTKETSLLLTSTTYSIDATQLLTQLHYNSNYEWRS